ncbi:hypothetical protein PFISCL1PPCAC_18329, partial [Pristionchus fissidentatus]
SHLCNPFHVALSDVHMSDEESYDGRNRLWRYTKRRETVISLPNERRDPGVKEGERAERNERWRREETIDISSDADSYYSDEPQSPRRMSIEEIMRMEEEAVARANPVIMEDERAELEERRAGTEPISTTSLSVHLYDGKKMKSWKRKVSKRTKKKKKNKREAKNGLREEESSEMSDPSSYSECESEEEEKKGKKRKKKKAKRKEERWRLEKKRKEEEEEDERTEEEEEEKSHRVLSMEEKLRRRRKIREFGVEESSQEEEGYGDKEKERSDEDELPILTIEDTAGESPTRAARAATAAAAHSSRESVAGGGGERREESTRQQRMESTVASQGRQRGKEKGERKGVSQRLSREISDKPVVSIRSWVILFVEGETNSPLFPHFIFRLEGLIEGNGDEIWKTSTIEKVRPPSILHTACKVYRLEGTMDAKRAKELGQESLISPFRHGFPIDWETRLFTFFEVMSKQSGIGEQVTKRRAKHHDDAWLMSEAKDGSERRKEKKKEREREKERRRVGAAARRAATAAAVEMSSSGKKKEKEK